MEQLSTEARNPRTHDLDEMAVCDLLHAMNAENQRVPEAVAASIPAIEASVDLIVERLRAGGRLLYLGAGTSGRLGLLDAVECPPSFGTDVGMVLGLEAGGQGPFTEADEGAEDRSELGEVDLRGSGLSEQDVVVGITASGRTPYVLGGLNYARATGAVTIALSCNTDAEVSAYADVAIEVETGPEALTGSTRLKAGSAQKLVLNMLSTAAMIRLGKVYENLMVDVQPTNEKLIARAQRVVAEATGCELAAAADYLERAGRTPKVAIVMLLAECDYESALERLANADGFVRRALQLD
ncbi:MAG: N-acetylmuramic acid 6-phosphate etherase [Egibacteraceae bacterium]